MKQFVFYKIKDRFKLILTKEMLYVFLDLISRNSIDNFDKIQISNLIEKIDKESFSNNIIEYFSKSNSFNVNCKGEFIINNNLSDDFEVLKIEDDHIILNANSLNSKFSKFISTYYPDLIIIDLINKQISSLRLVNPLQIS